MTDLGQVLWIVERIDARLAERRKLGDESVFEDEIMIRDLAKVLAEQFKREERLLAAIGQMEERLRRLEYGQR
jgi:hypothetical protein